MLVAIGITTILVLTGIAIVVAVGPWPADLARPSPGSRGTGLLAITSDAGQAGGPTSATARPLSTADADAIIRTVPGVTLISRVVFGTAVVSSGNLAPPIGIQAVDTSYALNPAVQVVRGAFFTADDAIAANRVVVLGARAASSLFPGTPSPIGQTIRIGDVPFTVIGVLGSQGNGPPDSSVLIPLQTGQVRLFGAGTGLGEVLLQVRDASQTNLIAQQVQQLLRMRHQPRAGQADGFTISTPSASAPVSNQFIERVQYLSEQFACQAKTLCAP